MEYIGIAIAGFIWIIALGFESFQKWVLVSILALFPSLLIMVLCKELLGANHFAIEDTFPFIFIACWFLINNSLKKGLD